MCDSPSIAARIQRSPRGMVEQLPRVERSVVQGDAARLRAFEQIAQQLLLRIQHLLMLIDRERDGK